MNPPDGQTPLDYLNQISTTPQKSSFMGLGLNIKTVLLLGGILVALTLILVVVVNTAGGSTKQSWQKLSARLDATSSIVDKASPQIKNSQLRSINSELKLYLSNTRRDLDVRLAALSVEKSKIATSVKSAESLDVVSKRLEDGRLNARYDATYSREMSYQLSTILTLYRQLLSSSDGANRSFLQTSYDNLAPIQQSIEDFSATTE